MRAFPVQSNLLEKPLVDSGISIKVKNVLKTNLKENCNLEQSV